MAESVQTMTVAVLMVFVETMVIGGDGGCEYESGGRCGVCGNDGVC